MTDGVQQIRQEGPGKPELWFTPSFQCYSFECSCTEYAKQFGIETAQVEA
jgi:hypothetical protein